RGRSFGLSFTRRRRGAARGGTAPGLFRLFLWRGGWLARLGRQREQLLRRHFVLADLCQLDDKVDDFFLEDRRAQIVRRLRVLAVVVENLTLRAGKALRLANQSLVELLLRHRNVGVPADFRKQQSEADATFGNAAVFGARLGLVLWRRDVGGALGRGLPRRKARRSVERWRGSVRFCRRSRDDSLAGAGRRPLALSLVFRPDLVELDLDHARRHREIVALGQLVE